MNQGFSRVALAIIIVLLAGVAAQPYIERGLYGTTSPKPVIPRGDLAESEKSTIELFERASPSVVHVVNLRGEAPGTVGEGGQVASGTGFVWDEVGHIVTNNHVVEGARAIGVVLASGTAIEADIVGRAPTYDLAVLKLKQTASLPPRLAV